MNEQYQLWVGNIPFDCAESELREIFSFAGPLSSFRFVYDRDSRNFRGHAYCSYFNMHSMLCAARLLNGFEVRDRSLKVECLDRYHQEILHNQRQEKEEKEKEFGGKNFHLTGTNNNDNRKLNNNSSNNNNNNTNSNNLSKNNQNNNNNNNRLVQNDNPEHLLEVAMIEAAASILRRTAGFPVSTILMLWASLQRLMKERPQQTEQMFEETPALSYFVLSAGYILGIIDKPVLPTSTHSKEDKADEEEAYPRLLQAVEAATDAADEAEAEFLITKSEKPKCAPIVAALAVTPLNTDNSTLAAPTSNPATVNSTISELHKIIPLQPLPNLNPPHPHQLQHQLPHQHPINQVHPLSHSKPVPPSNFPSHMHHLPIAAPPKLPNAPPLPPNTAMSLPPPPPPNTAALLTQLPPPASSNVPVYGRKK